MSKKTNQLKKAINLLKLVSHPVRLSILCNLIQQGEMSVTQLVEAENGHVSQSQISQFLSRMRSENLVTSRKQAQSVYYRIKSPQARQLVEALYAIYCSGE